MSGETPSPGSRTPEGRFAKGSSGNPSGLPKSLRKVRKALEAMDTRALRRLKRMLASADPEICLEAIKIWAKYRLPAPDSEARMVERRLDAIERRTASADGVQ